MARRVFFSFHYEGDIWRANCVRKSWVTQDGREAAGFWDASLWEKTKKEGDDAIKKMIEIGLNNTSVTAVLIGTETASREWVKYEIQKSYIRGNGLIGVHIYRICDQNGWSSSKGENPLDILGVTVNGKWKPLSNRYKTYDWIVDDGYNNFKNWVEEAAKIAGC